MRVDGRPIQWLCVALVVAGLPALRAASALTGPGQVNEMPGR